MGMHTKMPFYDKYWKKKYMILGCNNKESVAMAAILNKNVFSEHPSNFPENFSFLRFFSGWTLMLLGYMVCC